MATVRTAATGELRADEVRILRELFDAAWECEPDAFEDEDWEHAVGGLHFVLEDDGAIAAHASVVERELHTGGHELATGYVEAVATHPAHRRRGHGSAVLREVVAYIDRTSSWERWVATPPSTCPEDGASGRAPRSSALRPGWSGPSRRTGASSSAGPPRPPRSTSQRRSAAGGVPGTSGRREPLRHALASPRMAG